MSQVTTMALDDDKVRALIGEHLDSVKVRDRAGTLAGDLDALVRRALDSDAGELALALYALSCFDDAGLAVDAAGILGSRLVFLADRFPAEVTRGLLQSARDVRTCRTCGCTDARACEGGCRWVEEDLCSRCSPYPLPMCLVCSCEAPPDMEEATRSGWTTSGVCPNCRKKARRPS